MTTDPTQRFAVARIELFSNFLERAASLLANATSYQETLEGVGTLVVPLFADWCSVDLLEADGRWRRRLLQQDDPAMGSWQEVIFREGVPEVGARHPIQETATSGRSELVPVITDAWIASRTANEAFAAALRATGVRSALFLPLHSQGRLRGVLGMYAAEPGRSAYDHDDLRFGELLAAVIAAALRNVDYLTNAALELAERRRVEGELRESLDREAARLLELQRTEALLLQHRENLERMVRERTGALEDTHARLRESERMALIGTLSAGLGHDMRNLLLPLRLRLDSLNDMELPAAARADLEGIGAAVRYLQRLTSGLRLLARDPDGQARDQEITRLEPWWDEVQYLLKGALPDEVALTASLGTDLPPLAIGPAALTQIVFNLIQNSGHVLKGRPEPAVSIGSRTIADGKRIRIEVRDNGPGMTEETRRRCFEPFYSTKERELSTGLGLAVVRGLVERALGTIEVISSPGTGATFVLTFPVGSEVVAPTSRGGTAFITIKDPRSRALASTLSAHAEFDVLTERPERGSRRPGIWIADRAEIVDLAELERFVAGGPARSVVVLGPALPPGTRPEIKALDKITNLDALRALLHEQRARERALEREES